MLAVKAAVNNSDEQVLPKTNDGSIAAQPQTEEHHPDGMDILYADIPSTDTQVAHTSASGAGNMNDGRASSNKPGHEYTYIDTPSLAASSKGEPQEKNPASSDDSEYAYAEVNMKPNTTTVGNPRMPTDSEKHVSSRDHGGSSQQESTGNSYTYAEVKKGKRNESDTAPKVLGSDELPSSEKPGLTTSSEGGHQVKYPESSDDTEYAYAEVNLKNDNTVGSPRIPTGSNQHVATKGSPEREETGYSYAYAEVKKKGKHDELDIAPNTLGSALTSSEKPSSNSQIPTDSNQHVAIDGSRECEDSGYSYVYAEVKKDRNHPESDVTKNTQGPDCNSAGKHFLSTSPEGEPKEKNPNSSNEQEYAYAEVKMKDDAGTPRIPNDSNQHALSDKSDYTYAEVKKKGGHHEADIAEEGWEDNVSYHDSSVSLGGAGKCVVNEEEGWVDNSIYNME